jgi:ribonuclease Z
MNMDDLLANPVIKSFVKRVVRSAMDRRNVHFKDGLYAGLCGSGTPMPEIRRAGPCIAVLAGEHFFIVDAGQGSARNVLLMKFPIGKADAILLTHFHSDHIADLGEMELQRWAGGSNNSPVEVIGPKGVESVVEGFNLAYRLDAGYRVAHHGPETMPPSGAGGVAKPFELSSEPNA